MPFARSAVGLSRAAADALRSSTVLRQKAALSTARSTGRFQALCFVVCGLVLGDAAIDELGARPKRGTTHQNQWRLWLTLPLICFHRFGRTTQKDIVECERAGAPEDKGEKPCEIEKIGLISRLTKMRACSIYG